MFFRSRSIIRPSRSSPAYPVQSPKQCGAYSFEDYRWRGCRHQNSNFLLSYTRRYPSWHNPSSLPPLSPQAAAGQSQVLPVRYRCQARARTNPRASSHGADVCLWWRVWTLCNLWVSSSGRLLCPGLAFFLSADGRIDLVVNRPGMKPVLIEIKSAFLFWIFRKSPSEIMLKSHNWNSAVNPPHFHAEYGEHKASIRIRDYALLEGSLPPKTFGLVIEWASLHQQELENEWQLACERKKLINIAPLE